MWTHCPTRLRPPPSLSVPHCSACVPTGLILTRTISGCCSAHSAVPSATTCVGRMKLRNLVITTEPEHKRRWGRKRPLMGALGAAALLVSFASPAMADSDSSGEAEIPARSEEHTSELQSRGHLVCRLLREKKNEHN